MQGKGTYIYDGEAYLVFLTASTKLFDAVSHTLGKDGLNTAIPVGNGYLSIINDGKTILESLSSDDPAIKLAMNTLKESSFATNQNAGDGTTSTAVIQHALLESINAYNTEHPDKPFTSKHIIAMRDKLLSELPEYKKEIKSEDELRKVISVALGRDDLVDLVMEAFTYDGLSTKQRPALIKYKDKESTVLNINGVSLTPVEINPVVLREMPTVVNEELNVLIMTQNISRIDSAFTHILERIVKSNKKTILLYTEIMPSVMDQLLYNIQEGSLNLVPIRLAYPIDKIDTYTEELSKYFNLKVLNDINQYQVCYKDDDIFGHANGYIINKDSAVIKNDNDEYESELLPSKSSVINVGFVTYSQQEEDYRRIEDAIHSAYNALVYGYTIGAGYTYMCLSKCLDSSDTTLFPTEESYGMIEYSLGLVYNIISKDKDKLKFTDYCNDNIFDSYKVTEQVILNAFTVVAQVLSTKRLLVPYK